MRTYRRAVVLALAAAVVFAVWDGLAWGGADVSLVFTDAMTVLSPAAAAVACWWAAQRAPEAASRRAWRLIGAGAASWSVGNGIWSWYNLVLHTAVPFPSAADVGYLGFIPLAALGILSLPAAPRLGVSRWRATFDGLVIASSVLFLGWVAVLGQAYANASGTLVEKAFGLAYPLGDIVLLTVLLITLVRASIAQRSTLALLGLGLGGIMVSDVLFAYQTANGLYTTGQYISNGWFAGFLLIGLAGIRSRVAPTEGQATDHFASVQALVVPVVAVAAAILVAIWQEVTRGALEPFLFWMFQVIIAAVLARQGLSLIEQRRLAVAVEAALQRQEQLEAERVQLLNNVAHDLATPLSPIRLHLAILDRLGAGLPEPVRQSHAVIQRNAKHLGLLLTDLTDVARMDAGKLKILRAPMDLAVLLREAVESQSESAQERGVRLVAEVDEALPADADAGRLNQVVYNLLTNALKFTPTGGTVTVRGHRAGDDVVVEVQDSGRGLTPEERSRLFQPFTQVHKPGEVKELGTGLGLYISRGIVEGHGGTIDASSAGHGHGSTFRLRFPMRPAPAADPRPLPAAAPQVPVS